MKLSQQFLDDLTYEVIGAAIEVHKTMGRGLLESLYHACMKEELIYRKINFSTELKIPVFYRNKPLNMDFRCDLFVENCLVVELKAVSELNSVLKHNYSLI
jgi:GxxExxY protein